MIVVGIVLIIGGLFFLTVSAIGVVRLPDFYTRTHAVGKSETLGAILVLLGLAFYNGFQVSSLKLLIILIFIAIANPTATHAIARAAFFQKLAPWVKTKEEISQPKSSDSDG
jgi:multicomponent Na+:H+ antiporter subunit G